MKNESQDGKLSFNAALFKWSDDQTQRGLRFAVWLWAHLKDISTLVLFIYLIIFTLLGIVKFYVKMLLVINAIMVIF